MTGAEFGPPILEAMRMGGVDLGLAGDTPPIFAQAAKSDLLYVAAVPSGALAILLPAPLKGTVPNAVATRERM